MTNFIAIKLDHLFAFQEGKSTPEMKGFPSGILRAWRKKGSLFSTSPEAQSQESLVPGWAWRIGPPRQACFENEVRIISGNEIIARSFRVVPF